MFIIFIAHTPDNFLALWIPARFGFSDATEIFVFCSGMASALAFGAVFSSHGWLMGAGRIVFRVWQVYWAHIIVFFVIAALVAGVDQVFGLDGRYVDGLNLQHFFDDARPNLVGLLTLTYVPNFFDILPMYLVILALVPVIMALGRLSPWLVAAFVATLWVLAAARVLDLPAEPWSDRTWFFNPFSWQLVFFTGFAFMIGWLKPPPVSRGLVWLAVAIVAVTIPFAYFRILGAVPELAAANHALDSTGILINKTQFGLFRYIHFLALAYLAWLAAGEGGRRLTGGPAWTRFVAIVRNVGQQSLAVFLSGLVLARISGMVLDAIGGSKIATAIVTLAGCGILIVISYAVGWFKTQPWRYPPQKGVSTEKKPELFSGGRVPVPGE